MESLSKRLLLQALDAGPAAVVVVDMRDTPSIVFASQSVEALTGWDAAILAGAPLERLIVDGLPAPVADAETADGDAERRQRWRCPAGGECAVDVVARPLYARPGDATHWILWGRATPVGDAADPASTARLARRPVDHATGLADRSGFESHARRDWALARRAGLPLAMVLVRVDAFEAYRDLFGRHATDSMLRKVGHAISGSLRRANDLACRFADDRFVVLLGNATHEQAARVAARVEAKVRGLAVHHPRSPYGRYLSVSIGVASRVPSRAEPLAALVEAAEAALPEPLTEVGEPTGGVAVAAGRSG